MTLYKYDNLDNFLKDVFPSDGRLHHLLGGDKFIFRGESSLSYSLLPSSIRKDGYEKVCKHLNVTIRGKKGQLSEISAELLALKFFYQKCDNQNLNVPFIHEFQEDDISVWLGKKIMDGGIWIDERYYELAGLAQHYGIPTRLLDWSYDIWVSLYFATIGILGSQADIKDPAIVLWALNKSEVKTNKIKIIKPQYFGNPNLAAQKGVFTLVPQEHLPSVGNMDKITKPVEHKPLDEVIGEIYGENQQILIKIVIDSQQVKSMFRFLSKIGYDASRLFPGYDGITKSIRETQHTFLR